VREAQVGVFHGNLVSRPAAGGRKIYFTLT